MCGGLWLPSPSPQGESLHAVSIVTGRVGNPEGVSAATGPPSLRPLSLQRGTSPCAACAANLSDGSAPNCRTRLYWTRGKKPTYVAEVETSLSFSIEQGAQFRISFSRINVIHRESKD